MSNVLIFAEQRGGEIKKTAFEAVREGKRLASELGGQAVAVTAGGPGLEAAAGKLAQYGADQICIAENPLLEKYNTEGYVKVLEAAVEKVSPEIILLPASAMGKDLGAALAARLGTGLASDCVELSLRDGKLVAKRPVFAGKALVTMSFKKSPEIATLRPNVFTAGKPDESASAPVEKLDVSLSESDIRAKTVEVKLAEGKKADLTEAERIVSGGRGLKGPENFKLVEDLAETLGAAVGSSRAVVDAGWRPYAEQVGQTGKTVAPVLYVAVGISGAIQHLAGMRTAKTIVAINNDKDAPIFKVADYGVVGDAFEVVPALIEALKNSH